MQGFIYVLINPSMEGIVKIGKTSRDPKDRVNELSSATGVPEKFILVFHRSVSDCDLAEKLIHDHLNEKGLRLSKNREFFQLDVSSAVDEVIKICSDVNSQFSTNDEYKKSNDNSNIKDDQDDQDDDFGLYCLAGLCFFQVFEDLLTQTRFAEDGYEDLYEEQLAVCELYDSIYGFLLEDIDCLEPCLDGFDESASKVYKNAVSKLKADYDRYMYATDFLGFMISYSLLFGWKIPAIYSFALALKLFPHQDEIIVNKSLFQTISQMATDTVNHHRVEMGGFLKMLIKHANSVLLETKKVSVTYGKIHSDEDSYVIYKWSDYKSFLVTLEAWSLANPIISEEYLPSEELEESNLGYELYEKAEEVFLGYSDEISDPILAIEYLIKSIELGYTYSYKFYAEILLSGCEPELKPDPKKAYDQAMLGVRAGEDSCLILAARSAYKLNAKLKAVELLEKYMNSKVHIEGGEVFYLLHDAFIDKEGRHFFEMMLPLVENIKTKLKNYCDGSYFWRDSASEILRSI